MSTSRTRTRGPLYNFPVTKRAGKLYLRYGPSWYFMADYYANPYMYETAKCVDNTNPGPPYRTGGALYLVRGHVEAAKSAFSSGIFYGNGYKYEGEFWFNPPTSVPWVSDYNTWNTGSGDAASYGATAWNKFHPVKPKADVGQFLVELRDWKSMLKVRLSKFKDIGGAYLNYRFGWLPFLNDIRKFLKACENLQKSIDFVRKNNGKWIKRGGIVNQATGTTQPPGLQGQNSIIPAVSAIARPYGTWTTASVYRHTYERTWFKARMKYYIPDLAKDPAGTSKGTLFNSALLRKLYGAELTPALVWELLPWSWLADWFGNVGDVMANVSNDLYSKPVAKYSWLMRQRQVVYEITQTQPLGDGSAITSRGLVEVISKERVAGASPYGFDVGWQDLSASQAAILAALGISRGR